MDIESGSVRAEAEPEDEGDEANDEEEAQENAADNLGDSGGEAVVDPMHVVPGGMVPLNGFWVRTRYMLNGYVGIAAVVHYFGLFDE